MWIFLSIFLTFFITQCLVPCGATRGEFCAGVGGMSRDVGICRKLRRCLSHKGVPLPRNHEFSVGCRWPSKVCCIRPHDVHFPGHFEPPVTERRSVRRDVTTTTTTTTTTTAAPVVVSASDQPIPNLRVRGCGVKEINMTDFVVGGRDADYWPWMAAVFYRPRDGAPPRFQCGGTVISRRYLLTAAHCLQSAGVNISPIRLTIRMGGLTQEGDGQVHRVANFTLHPQYRNNLRYNDIAVIRLSRDIYSKNVVPACLPSPGMYSSNFFQRNATVLGYGHTSELSASLSNSLKEADVSVVPNSRCNARYRRLNSLSLPRGIVDTQLCAGADDGTVDACQGDSGGPLTLQDRSLRWNVIGIVSFGYGCAHPDYPGVYTRVAKYLPWLRDVTDIPARYT